VKLSAKTRRLIREALAEDIGRGDVTSRALIEKSARGRAVVLARQAGIVCGLALAAEVFRKLDRRLRVRALKRDGAALKPNARVLEIRGPLRSILTAERTALNFLQHLSGIATLASRFSKAVRGTKCRILDTRKTTPGWRELEKFAVRCGGAANHRMKLDELALIKDNHLAAMGGAGRIGRAVALAKKSRIGIEIECERLGQVRRALDAGADRILLDNMTPRLLRKAVRMAKRSRRKVRLEASGGVSLANVRRIAKTGVDFISVGAITHSAPALDFTLEVLAFPRRKRDRWSDGSLDP
jgi:nicotinate-nucleotide pyrophosphorylase (carboxylating)